MPIDPEYLHAVRQGPFPAYLYGRASRDPKKKGRSVNDQLKEGRTLCDKHGWPIVEEFKDLGISASRHARERRDDFETMLDGIRAGKCRIVVAFEASRYYRDLDAYTRLRKACHDSGTLLYYKGQVYDLSKSADRKATAMDAVHAESEAEDIRDRNLRTARLTAEAGKPWGPVPDGYKRVYDPDSGDLVEQVEHPDQGPVVRQIWADAAAGKSLRSTAARLNAENRRTQRGKPWEVWHLRTILRNPAYTGRRVFQGQDYKKGTWPALVEADVFESVQSLLDMEGRAWATDLTPTHLLSGIALCGEHPELAATTSEPVLRGYVNRGYPSLRCTERAHTTINEAKLTAYVKLALLDYLSTEAARDAFEAMDSDEEGAVARARLKGLEGQLREAEEAATTFDATGTPGLSIAMLNATELRLKPLIAAAQQAAKPRVVPAVVRALLTSKDPYALWEEYDLQQQRAVIRLCMTVRLHKASGPGVRSIQPGRVTIAYQGEPGFMGGLRRGRALPPDRESGLPGAL
ncbi:recombinase family protein [Streptomyces sp. NBC_00249]|uniref:recombinase family protein n=1 Tax=Streptomyces sp. NBC_00249 TaxID=2975690 RepID=UPI0022501309|nr:recombinase family protein [Streptomyces sp. NBC_00249]MCX5197174.1 recombinase family protein [Streptomyces sp. NBC_00249]